MYTDVKAVLSGNFLEIKKYSKQIRYDFSVPDRLRDKRQEDESSSAISRQVADYRTKRRIRQLIHANAYQWKNLHGKPFVPVFVTLTFRENITDVKSANSVFTKFVKRLNYQIYRSKVQVLKYLVVVEFQKRGAVHYHVVFFNLPFIKSNPHEFLASVWDQGFIKLNGINNVQHLSNYVVKYLTKTVRDDRLLGQKYYFVSRHLIQPIEVYDSESIQKILTSLPYNTKVFKTQYTTYTKDKVYFEFYTLPENTKLKIKAL